MGLNPNNNNMQAENMRVFLKGVKLCCYLPHNTPKPVIRKGEPNINSLNSRRWVATSLLEQFVAPGPAEALDNDLGFVRFNIEEKCKARGFSRGFTDFVPKK